MAVATTEPRTGAVSGASSLLHTPTDRPLLGGLLVLPGHNADRMQARQGGAWSDHPRALAADGWAVMSVDTNVPTTNWPSAAVMSRIDAAYTNLASLIGGGTPKIAVMGWSMGGGNALNWIKRNPSKVSRAWLWTPLTDTDWAYGLAGYTPVYSTGGLTPVAGWAAELDSLHSGNYATNGNGYRIHDEPASWRGIGVPIRLCPATDDTTLPIGAATRFVTDVADANVTQRNTTGDHTGAFFNVPTAEVVTFFRGWS